jgi:predicted RNA-binding Zn-ribbon protein involved in translation (DUF1610 family)
MNSTIDCPSCRQSVTPREFIAGCSHYWRDLDVVRFTCPKCGKDTDAQLETSKVVFGYVYAAGSAHFCGVDEIVVEGLEVSRDRSNLAAHLDGQDWIIGERKAP